MLVTMFGVDAIGKEFDDKLKLIEGFCDVHPIPQRTYKVWDGTGSKRVKKGESFGWTEQEESEK